MTRLLAVDGNSLGHRAWHSSRDATEEGDRRPLTTGSVVSMLATAWRYGPYDGVVVGFDHPTNRRKLEYPEYKATRPPTPEPLRDALRRLRTDLDACGFAVMEHDGAEADDVLAAVADACEHRAWTCDVLSSDRDLTALVSDTTRLLRPRARFADLEVEDVQAVQQRYGIAPEHYTEFAALRGDPSDGLAGASGIGPKTASRLLQDHGSISGIYTALHDLPPKVEAALRAGREAVERNLLLMAPLPAVPVDIDQVPAVDPDRVDATLGSLELPGAARRFRRSVLQPPPPMPEPPAEPPPDHEGAHPQAASSNEPSDEASRIATRARRLPPDPADVVQDALF